MAKEKGKHDLYRGSIVTLRRRCGKPNCRCKDGKPHETPALSYSVKGSTCMLTLREADIPKVKAGLARYRRELTALDAEALRSIERLRQKTQAEKRAAR